MYDDFQAAQRLIAEREAAGEVDRPISPNWDTNFRSPSLALPPGACDCHFHLIGPQKIFPLNEKRVFQYLVFEDDDFDAWLAMQEAMGLSRGLHVQTMMYGYYYQPVLHSLLQAPDRLRAVVAVPDDILDGELAILEDAGVIGARLASSVSAVIDDRLVDRLVERGWQMHYLYQSVNLPDWRDRILRARGTFVIEHMGVTPPELGLRSAEFRFLEQSLDTGRCWVKLSPRVSNEATFPFSDIRPIVDALIQRFPSRLLWGSDWPHPQYFRPMPNDADLVDLAAEWTDNDPHLLKQIFVDNPAEAFNWPLS